MGPARMNVVVTGSTKGIGFGLASEFAKRGHNVMVTSRSAQSAASTAEQIAAVSPGAALYAHAVDVSDYESVQSLWDHAVDSMSSVDMWINNAGLAVSTRTIVDNTPNEIAAMVTTNMLGTMFGAKVAATGMLAARGGRIVNILGGGSDGRFRPGQAIYSSTKRGLNLFTEALIKELKGTPVAVASVRPGILLTDGFIREAGEEDPATFAKQRKALNILADPPEDVTPWIVDQLLSHPEHGAKIQWLTNAKIAGRFATSYKKRDILTRYGLENRRLGWIAFARE